MSVTVADIAKMIDHSLLNPVLTTEELEAGLKLAVEYDVASVCILPFYLRRCAEVLRETTVQPSTTIGFPHGGHTTAMKRAEAALAISEGCTELDMVVNIGQVLSGNWDYVRNEIRAVVDAAHAHGRKVKVIFENCYLKDEHKIRLCEICSELDADWVKTSTGYGSGGSTWEDLVLMRKHSAPHVQVKAAGGLRDLDSILKARSLGVTRVGCSRTKDVLDDARGRLA
ncbi:Deoxyribose-phosphate aldolase 2 [Caulifigura coniformis]|uniref:Deoxyribose-phosphate aldolase n=1 Tax=Caulifigura coniformis TaxID=2527983 RepID=A0A517S992_9PLAN|nr:deoxyribose-phosphate aldolase [Caulifigura coniformis]QDT52666.1 Deoxyribose-phosphate aldolase 2 [Caulifigura coniformis]